MENMDTYSEEVEIGKKKVKITLEFPYATDPKDVDRIEHMLKEVYLNKIQKGSLQSSFQAASFPQKERKCEMNSHREISSHCEISSHREISSQGGMSYE